MPSPTEGGALSPSPTEGGPLPQVRLGYCVGGGAPPSSQTGYCVGSGPLPRVLSENNLQKDSLALSLPSLSPSFSERLSPLFSLSFISNSHVYIGKYTRGPQKLDAVYTLGYNMAQYTKSLVGCIVHCMIS